MKLADFAIKVHSIGSIDIDNHNKFSKFLPKIVAYFLCWHGCENVHTRITFRKFYSAEIRGRILISIAVDEHWPGKLLIFTNIGIGVLFACDWNVSASVHSFIIRSHSRLYWSWVYQCWYASCYKKGRERKGNIRVWKTNILQRITPIHRTRMYVWFIMLPSLVNLDKLAEFAIRNHELFCIS